MPDSPILTSLAIAALFVVVLWFAVGTQWNVRRGNALLRWLQTGLPLLGRRTTLRWLGSSAVELTILEPAAPFRDVTVVVVLEPRDVLWLWAASRRWGRRDLIIVRANLRRAPVAELEMADSTTWSARLPVQPFDEAALPEVDSSFAGGGEVTVRASAVADMGASRRVWEMLDAASGGVCRLSVRQTVPHLEVHVRPPFPGVSAERLIAAVRDAAVELGSRQG